MRFIDFEKKGRIWLISFDPKIALTFFLYINNPCNLKFGVLPRLVCLLNHSFGIDTLLLMNGRRTATLARRPI